DGPADALGPAHALGPAATEQADINLPAVVADEPDLGAYGGFDPSMIIDMDDLGGDDRDIADFSEDRSPENPKK
ncbi:MAG: hypothetical protein RBS21_04195, partial [Corynebacterium sp.]|nr:hypothetical protein [Corynebacterium sp.]